jgi:hypothetical protein
MPMPVLAPALLACALPLPGGCEPPQADLKEAEPCGAPWVSGCGDLMHPTEPIEPGVALLGTFWSDRSRRDTDFYKFTVPEPTTVVARAWSTETVQLVIVDACTIAGGDIGTCPVAEACLAAGTYEVFVAPLDTIVGCGTVASTYVVLAEFRDGSACVPAVGDFDGDGTVNGADITQLLIAWGTDNPGSRDLNADGEVDGVDLGMLLEHWTR